MWSRLRAQHRPGRYSGPRASERGQAFQLPTAARYCTPVHHRLKLLPQLRSRLCFYSPANNLHQIVELDRRRVRSNSGLVEELDVLAFNSQSIVFIDETVGLYLHLRVCDAFLQTEADVVRIEVCSKVRSETACQT